MKKISLFAYLLSNTYLVVIYITEISAYFLNVYNYDGFRYLQPIFIADILFLISLLFLLISTGNRKLFFYLASLSILHNINMGLGVENIPFIGIAIGLISIFFVLKSYFIKQKQTDN